MKERKAPNVTVVFENVYRHLKKENLNFIDEIAIDIERYFNKGLTGEQLRKLVGDAFIAGAYSAIDEGWKIRGKDVDEAGEEALDNLLMILIGDRRKYRASR